MGELVNREKVFKILEQQLETKNVSQSQLKKAQEEIEDYIKTLESELQFKTSVLLEEFVTARR